MSSLSLMISANAFPRKKKSHFIFKVNAQLGTISLYIKERKRERGGERGREREREYVCACVHTHAHESVLKETSQNVKKSRKNE